jgi:DNA-binding FadR family transcriptional regulator
VQAAVKLRTDLLKLRAYGPNQQLCQQLLARIRRGKFLWRNLLPSENQLCEQYRLSVTAARRTFVEVAKEGDSQREASVGTLVALRVRRARLTVGDNASSAAPGATNPLSGASLARRLSGLEGCGFAKRRSSRWAARSSSSDSSR